MRRRIGLLGLSLSLMTWLALAPTPVAAYAGWTFSQDQWQCANWYYPVNDDGGCAWTGYGVHFSMSYGPLPNGRMRYLVGPITADSSIHNAKALGFPSVMHLSATYKILSTSGSVIATGTLSTAGGCGFTVVHTSIDYNGTICTTTKTTIATTAYPPGTLKVTMSWPGKDVTPNGFIYTMSVPLR